MLTTDTVSVCVTAAFVQIVLNGNGIYVLHRGKWQPVVGNDDSYL